VLRFWAQNGRKTPPIWAQIGGWLVSKGSRINMNFAGLWSGRWESNPRPKLGKLAIQTQQTLDWRHFYRFESLSNGK
jgi:hypothetical protein